MSTSAGSGLLTSAVAGLRDRTQLLGGLCQAGSAAIAALLTVQLVAGLVPAALALTMERLVDSLLAGAPATAWLIALGAVILAGRLAQTALTPAAYLVTQRIDTARRAALSRLAVSELPMC